MESEEVQLEDDLFVDDDEEVATKKTDMAIPTTVMDAEFDLESEERRSVEEQTFLQKETIPTYLGLMNLGQMSCETSSFGRCQTHTYRRHGKRLQEIRSICNVAAKGGGDYGFETF